MHAFNDSAHDCIRLGISMCKADFESASDLVTLLKVGHSDETWLHNVGWCLRCESLAVDGQVASAILVEVIACVECFV